jgi:hypothetical protein
MSSSSREVSEKTFEARQRYIAGVMKKENEQGDNGDQISSQVATPTGNGKI